MERPLTALRLLIASLAIACVLAGPAAAQDSLPDPNDPAAEESAGAGLPNTGLPTAALLTAGLSLMAGGVAVLPAARRRRTHSSFVWRSAVAVRARRG